MGQSSLIRVIEVQHEALNPAVKEANPIAPHASVRRQCRTAGHRRCHSLNIPSQQMIDLVTWKPPTASGQRLGTA